MTRLLTTGWETGDINEANGVSTLGANGIITAVSSSPTPRGGSYCLKCLSNTPTTSQCSKTFSFAAAKTEVWVRFAFFMHAPTGSVAEVQIAGLNDSAGGAQTSITYAPNDGLIRLYRGTATFLATASALFFPDTWHLIDWRTQLLTTTTGTSEVWVDGNRVINFSGDASNTTTLNVLSLQIGSPTSQPAGLYLAFDDLAVNDTAGTINTGRIGDGRVVLLTPSGAGSSTALTRGGTDTGANFSQTNELPPSMTQYVFSATATTRDLYALTDLPITPASINVVEELLYCQNSDAGAGSIGPTIKSGATTNEQTAVAMTSTPGYVVGRWEVDPNTTAAWTAAAVNALEAGSTVR
jgi:hypothetical protein